jgi:anti-repressor protein
MSQSTDLQTFPIPGEAANLRVLLIRDEPWFVAADVARTLGYRDAANAVRVLKDDERGTHQMSTLSGQQEYVIISEPGFYRLVMRSNRPEADTFQRWVTGEVLPSIRRTGSYGQLVRLPGSFSEALRELAAEVEKREAAELEARAAHEQRVEAVTRAAVLDRQLTATVGELGAALPKVAAYDAFLDQAGAYPLATAAQLLGMGRQTLINLLGGWKVLIIRPGHSDHLRPYTEHIHAGRFVVKSQDVPITHRDGTNEVITRGTTLVTPKGLDYIARRRRRDGLRPIGRVASM